MNLRSNKNNIIQVVKINNMIINIVNKINKIKITKNINKIYIAMKKIKMM